MSTNLRGDATRAQILDAAWALISEKGADVSLSEIAKKVGVTRQALHLHFGKRGGLLIAMVRRADERANIIEAFTDNLSETDPALRLEKHIDIWLDFLPEIYPVARDLVRLRDTDPDASAAWEDRMSHLRKLTQALTGTLEADGVLNPNWTSKDAADYLWTMLSLQSWDLLTRDCAWPEDKVKATLKSQAVTAMTGMRPES